MSSHYARLEHLYWIFSPKFPDAYADARVYGLHTTVAALSKMGIEQQPSIVGRVMQAIESSVVFLMTIYGLNSNQKKGWLYMLTLFPLVVEDI
jgi:hypothetical protein